MARGAGGESVLPAGHHFNCDLSDPSLQLPELGHPLDGLAYLPGSITVKPFLRLTDDDFMNDLQVNLLGAVRAVRQYLGNLKATNNSSLVFLSTVAVQLGLPYHASISSAKGAIEGLTRSLAAELAPDIRVNAVAPSLVDTPLAGRFLSSDKKREQMATRHPLQTIGSPEKVAALIAYLMSDDGSWMTGQVLALDGGMSSIKVA